MITKEQMKKLSELSGLEFDGGDDDRLFYDYESIDVYVKGMSEKEYEEMERRIDVFSINRDKYHVYVWNDCSGYDYWAKSGDLNYIKVTVGVECSDMTLEEIEQMKDDVRSAYCEFCEYDSVNEYIENELE